MFSFYPDTPGANMPTTIPIASSVANARRLGIGVSTITTNRDLVVVAALVCVVLLLTIWLADLFPLSADVAASLAGAVT
jgi:hypothetical protein